MKKRNVIFLALIASILFSIEGFAVFEAKPYSARPQGMGGAFTGLADDASAISYNPAGLSQLESMEVNTYYSQLFGLTDLQQQLFCVAVPVNKYAKSKRKAGTAGLLYSSFGSDILMEKTVTLSYGFDVSDDFALGVNLNNYMLSIQEFGSASALGVDFGILTKVKRVRRNFGFGLFLNNFNGPRMGKEFPKELSRTVAMGVSYTPYEGAVTTVDLSKELLVNATTFKIGQEFLVGKFLFLRAGIQFDPQRFSVGFGTKIKNVRIDYSFYSHGILPSTHLISLDLKFPKK
jgi:long-subunit fatty acid transport protein